MFAKEILPVLTHPRKLFQQTRKPEIRNPMESESQYDSSGAGTSALILAAVELREIAQLEFLLDSQSANGLALSQIALYLLRIEHGIAPFPQGARAFVDSLRNSYRRGSRAAIR